MNPATLTNQSYLHLLTIQFQLRCPSMFSRNAISNARKLSSQCVGLMGKLISTSAFSTCQPASMATRSENKQRNFRFSETLTLSRLRSLVTASASLTKTGLSWRQGLLPPSLQRSLRMIRDGRYRKLSLVSLLKVTLICTASLILQVR